MTKKPKYEIQRTLVISTAHITKCDDTLLGKDNLYGISVEPLTAGYRLFINEDSAARKSAIQDGASKALCDLIELAFKQKCCWLDLDPDGPVVDGLPKFDW